MNIFAKRKATEEDKKRAEQERKNPKPNDWDTSGRGDTWRTPDPNYHSPGPSGLS